MRAGICLCLFVVGVLASPAAVQAQPSEQDASRFKVDFTIPESPAFALLDEAPGTILSPGTVRDIDFGISDFAGRSGDVSLPRSFGVEVSPALLIGGASLTVDDYREKAWLYRTRVSLAAHRAEEDGAGGILALGLRVTSTDESDLRTNPKYLTEATAYAAEVEHIIAEAKIAAAEAGRGRLSREEVKCQPEVRAQIEKLDVQFREAWADSMWNARIVGYALAIRAEAPDSQETGLKVNNLSFWYTSGYGFDRWGQFLWGVTGALVRPTPEDDLTPSGRLAARFYVGTNAYKVFVETVGAVTEDGKPYYLIQGGGDVRASGNIWVDFAAGIEYDRTSGNNRLVTDLKLRYGI